jgi:hypothetical protein
MMTDMTNWKDADPADGYIPHEDGKVKWYVMTMEEHEYYYVGEFDMTDWDKTFEEVFAKAKDYMDKCFRHTDDWQMIRKDQVIDLMWNCASCLRESGDYKEEWLPMDIFDEDEE